MKTYLPGSAVVMEDVSTGAAERLLSGLFIAAISSFPKCRILRGGAAYDTKLGRERFFAFSAK
jgi:hypothetical protein